MSPALQTPAWSAFAWIAESDLASATLPWLAALVVLTTAGAAFGVWNLVARVRELGQLSTRFEALDEIRSGLQALVRDRGDLDLRRLEHVLIEIRDGQRRLEDAILRATQTPVSPAAAETGAATSEATQRVIARLVANGYERVQIVPSAAEIEALFAAGGMQEVLVEARRNGVLCKGRVLVRDGAVTDVELSPAYSMFP